MAVACGMRLQRRIGPACAGGPGESPSSICAIARRWVRAMLSVGVWFRRTVLGFTGSHQPPSSGRMCQNPASENPRLDDVCVGFRAGSHKVLCCWSDAQLHTVAPPGHRQLRRLVVSPWKNVGAVWWVSLPGTGGTCWNGHGRNTLARTTHQRPGFVVSRLYQRTSILLAVVNPARMVLNTTA